MAKRVKTTTVKEELPEQEPELVDLSGDASAINAILQRFSDDAVAIEVYKDEMGQMEYCETIRSKTIDKDQIRDSWGGGKFEIRIFNQGELDSTVQFRIANRKIPLNVPGVNPNENLLRDQNRFFERMIMALLMQKNENGNGGHGFNVKDIFEMMLESQKSNNPERTLDILTRGMELGAKSNGTQASSDWKSEVVATVRDLGKSVLPTIVEIAAARQAVPGANGQMPQTQQIPAVTSDAILKQGIAELKSYVMKGLPVSLALDWVIANGEKYQHIIKAVVAQGAEKLEALDPDLAQEPYKSWINTLIEGLKNVYRSNSNDNDENSDGDTGDGGDVASNGGIG